MEEPRARHTVSAVRDRWRDWWEARGGTAVTVVAVALAVAVGAVVLSRPGDGRAADPPEVTGRRAGPVSTERPTVPDTATETTATTVPSGPAPVREPGPDAPVTGPDGPEPLPDPGGEVVDDPDLAPPAPPPPVPEPAELLSLPVCSYLGVEQVAALTGETTRVDVDAPGWCSHLNDRVRIDVFTFDGAVLARGAHRPEMIPYGGVGDVAAWNVEADGSLRFLAVAGDVGVKVSWIPSPGPGRVDALAAIARVVLAAA